MSGQSPSSVLYSSDGYELAVIDSTPIPVGTRGLLVEGSDGTDSRFILVDSSGRQVVVGSTAAGAGASTGLITIQGNAAGTPVPVSGTVAVTQSTSPWVVSGTVTSNQGTPNSLANAWPITITDGYGNIQGSAANPVWVEGTINANNQSVGPDGAVALAFDTQVGGKVTTAAPTYVTGNLNAFSLTTLGGLRIDGVYAVATANATAADVGSVGGYVTTAAPTYTTGQLNPISLTTTGLLRIDGVYPINTTTPTTDVTFVGGAVTTAAPTYTTGQLSALSLDTSGNLRVTGFVTTNKASTSAVTSVPGATTNTSILAANPSRVFASIYNGMNKNMYVLLNGGTARSSNYSILLITGSYWEVPNDWTGAIQAVWANGVSGNALVTELTP